MEDKGGSAARFRILVQKDGGQRCGRPGSGGQSMDARCPKRLTRNTSGLQRLLEKVKRWERGCGVYVDVWLAFWRSVLPRGVRMRTRLNLAWLIVM